LTNSRCAWGLEPLDGCAERIFYRQLFPSGLIAFDSLDESTLKFGRVGHISQRSRLRAIFTHYCSCRPMIGRAAERPPAANGLLRAMRRLIQAMFSSSESLNFGRPYTAGPPVSRRRKKSWRFTRNAALWIAASIEAQVDASPPRTRKYVGPLTWV